MFIRDILKARRPSVSFELFPPKKDSAFLEAKQVAFRSAELKPDFISITCGAAGAARGQAVPLAAYTESLGVTALAHITSVTASRDDIDGLLQSVSAAGIKNILALRGDLPDGMTLSSDRHYLHAADLVAEIKSRGDFCIGAACYPERHPEAASFDEDIRHLREKADAGCDFLTTQMFFDNGVLYKFLYKIREAGITLPVLAGIMPITNKRQMERTLKLSAARPPARFANIVDRFGDDDAAMQQAGIASAVEQIVDLIANGVAGIHIYTMNRPEVASEIMRAISSLRGGAL